jgi:UDP-glucose 4-epimerase
LKKKKILITGGLGYIGGRLSKILSYQYEIIISSRKVVSAESLILLNASHAVLHTNLFSADSFPNDIYAIIHLASLNEIDSVSSIDDAINVNIGDTIKIAKLAIKKKVSKFLYFSTVHVYGSPLQGLINEQSSCNPTHPYAATHKSAEDLLKFLYQNVLNEKLIILRLSNSFGYPIAPDVNRWTLVFNDLCKKAIINGCIQIQSSTNQSRDYITLSDVCAVILNLLHETTITPSASTYNLSSGKSLTLTDVCSIIQKTFNSLYGKSIEAIYPNNFNINETLALEISNKKIVSLLHPIENNYQLEVAQLLNFCKIHFGKN